MGRRDLCRFGSLPSSDRTNQVTVLTTHLSSTLWWIQRGLGGGQDSVPEGVDSRATERAIGHLVDHLVEGPIRDHGGVGIAFIGGSLSLVGGPLEAAQLGRRDFAGCYPLGGELGVQALETGPHEERAAQLPIVHPRGAKAATVRQRKPCDLEPA
jgi:hypothetical protein